MSQNNQQQESFDPSTFDNYSELYDTALDWPYRKTLELPTVKNLLGDLSNFKIMDFGCGPGVITRWLHLLGAKKVIGFDISLGMLDYAKMIEQKSPLGIDYISDLAEIPSETLDIVIAFYVVPYLTNQYDLLEMFKSIYNTLKPGGKFITLPVHPDFSGEANYYSHFGFNLIETEPRKDGSKLKLELRMPPEDIDIEAYYWSRETLNETLKLSGFKNIEWPKLEIPLNLSPEFKPYAASPHAAIIQATK